MEATGRRSLYSPIDPFNRGRLDVGDGHSLYWEMCGNPDGKPVVFLHGGPGAGISQNHRRLFNPDRYKILLFDQRGCGRSTPNGSLEANTTWHLVEDIEKLRETAGVSQWMVFGGSWGSTLSLAYAQSYPERVTELVLRGIWLFQRHEVEWVYAHGGASQLFPEKWDDFTAPIAQGEHGDLIEAYHRRLTSGDMDEQLVAAQAWCKWEADIVTLLPNEANVEEFTQPQTAVATARIENHYMKACGWLEEDQLLHNACRLREIPGIIVQGRYDVCTPPAAAWQLKQAWPQAAIEIIPDAGHMYNEPGILDALIRATDHFVSDR